MNLQSNARHPPCLQAGAASVRLQGGFTLIEVLIALVVLSFGMLGAVGMQAYALQANRDARMQAQAANLARELAEMIRGNKAVGAKTTAADNPYLVDLSGSMSAAPAEYCMSVSNASTGCSGARAVASAEMTDWLARVKTELPGARVKVCFDSAPFGADGRGQWDCGNNATDILAIKIGWSRTSLNRSATGASVIDDATSAGSVPAIVFPITSGNSDGDT